MIQRLRCEPPVYSQAQRYAHLRAEHGSINPACWSWEVEARDLADARTCPEHFGHVLLWNWQRGQCAVCACSVDDNAPLVRDHDHETGLLRGLLCQRCNSQEGISLAVSKREFRTAKARWRWGDAEENKLAAERFARYRAVTPAAMLGIKVRHSMTHVAYGAFILPTRYKGDLPILDIAPSLLRRFHKVTQIERGKDNRVPVLWQFMAWYARLPGAKLPKRPQPQPARDNSSTEEETRG